MKIKYSVRMMLVAIAGVGVVLGALVAVLRWNDPAARYRRTGDATSLSAVLQDRVRDGDPIERVEGMLGKAGRMTDPRMKAHYLKVARTSPSTNPQGGEDRDEFLTYSAGAWNIVLHARDGRFVNFNPAEYAPITGGLLSR